MRITHTRYARGVRALHRRLAASDGVVLLWALLIMFVLLITTAGAANLVTSNEAAFGRDNTSVSALDISEAGIASAFAAIKSEGSTGGLPDTDSSLATNGALGGGTWSYTATRTQSTTDSTQYTWTVTSIGTLGQSTHTVQDELAQTIVPTSQTTTQTTTTPASSAYGYGVFLGAATSDCSAYSPSGPQNTLGNSGTVSTSVYVAGSLCLSGNAQIQEPASSSGETLTLYVGGKLMTSNEASAVGTASKPLKSVTVVGGCVDGNHTTTTGSKKNPPIVTTYDPVPCSHTGTPLTCITCTGYGSGVYATPLIGYSSSQQTITKPTIDLNWYSNAEPGPAHGCNSYGTGTSFYPSGWTATKFDQTVFDNDTTRNTSLSGSPNAGTGNIDLGQIVSRSGSGHAANSFDCRFYDSNGNLVGELAFNYPASGSESSSNPGILTIDGTVFIDGNLDFSGNDYIEYQGVGTIYVNGTVTVEAGASLCAVPISGSPCVGNFNPSQNLLELVAINAGNAANGWSMSGAGTFEGIAFTNGNYNGGNGSALNGPVIADTGTFSGANSDQDTFTPPAGAPGAAATSTTTTTTSGPDQVSFASDPGAWEQLK